MKPSETIAALKHVLIADRLRAQILAGEFKPGARLPSFATLRAEYSASEDTIERVYANLESERIVVRRHRVGTFVAKLEETARSANSRQQLGSLGVMIPQQLQSDNYYTRILSGIQAASRAADVDIVLLNESSKPRWEKVDGVVTLGPTWGFPAPPPGMPLVSLLHEVRGATCVFSNDEGGTRQLTQHLLELGHRKIGYLHAASVKPDDWQYWSNNIVDARVKGYRETLGAAGIEARGTWLRPLLTTEQRTALPKRDYADHRTLGRDAMDKWLRDGWRDLGCTALLAQNDLVAIGVVKALQEAGLRVPEDVSVVGFDGHEAGDYFHPRLTTAVVPLEAIAERGTKLLIEQVRAPLGSKLGSKKAPRDGAKSLSVVLPTTLKMGQSSGPPRELPLSA